MEKGSIIELAQHLADELTKDVELSATREEHIRVSARANAARHLAIAVEELQSAGQEPDATLF
jgi:hypothetical protein